MREEYALFTTIDHIGLAVNDIAEAIALYRTQFGVLDWEIIELPERHMRVAVTHIGTSMVELIAPTSDLCEILARKRSWHASYCLSR
jgi:hypothetical protein